MTATATGTDQLAGLDWDHTPRCESDDHDGRPATHRQVAILCGCILLYCTDCAIQNQREINEGERGLALSCGRCRREFGVGAEADFWRIEPLP